MPRRLRRSYARRRARRTVRKYRRRQRLRAAASGQRQTARFVVKASGTDNIIIQATTPTGFGLTDVPNYAGTACIGAYQNLVKSAYFTSIAKMYDQVRVDWMKVKITPTMSVLLQGQKQALFVSAWDRNGVTNPRNIPGFAEIASYSSAFQRPINLDATVWSVTRRINAVTIAEKSLFLPTSALLSAAGGDISNTGLALTIGQTLAAQWNPQLLIGVMLSATSYSATLQGPERTTLAQTQTWNYFTQIEYGLTFRGLRYDIPNGPAPMVQTYSVINPVAQPNVDYTTVESSLPPTGPVRPPVATIPGVFGPEVVYATRMYWGAETADNELSYSAPFILVPNSEGITLTTTHPGYVDICQYIYYRRDQRTIGVGVMWIVSGTTRLLPATDLWFVRLVGSVRRAAATAAVTITYNVGLGDNVTSRTLDYSPTATHGEGGAAYTATEAWAYSTIGGTPLTFKLPGDISIPASSNTINLWELQHDYGTRVIDQ